MCFGKYILSLDNFLNLLHMHTHTHFPKRKCKRNWIQRKVGRKQKEQENREGYENKFVQTIKKKRGKIFNDFLIKKEKKKSVSKEQQIYKVKKKNNLSYQRKKWRNKKIPIIFPPEMCTQYSN